MSNHYLLLSLLVDAGEELHEEDRVKQAQDYRLKVEEIRVAREAVDPSDPHKECVLKGVHESEDYHDLALDIV